MRNLLGLVSFFSGLFAWLPLYSATLSSISFDEVMLESGPDTFLAYQTVKGTLRLSSQFRLSGFQSVEVQDQPGNRDTPDLQLYFPPQKSGRIYFHFAILFTNSSERMNLAFAGPRSFHLEKEGNAFWLGTRKSELIAYSKGKPTRLLKLQDFRWYIFDGIYDIDQGNFDLRIHEEGKSDPLFEKMGVPNASGIAGTPISRLSFIGDAPPVYQMNDQGKQEQVSQTGRDESKALYYVDDVLVRNDHADELPPFVAPGRRKLFVDQWHAIAKENRITKECFPVTSIKDVGFEERDIASLKEKELMEALRKLYFSKSKLEKVPSAFEDHFKAGMAWKEGCLAQSRGDFQKALQNFETALSFFPNAVAFRLSVLQANAYLKNWEKVDMDLLLYRHLLDDDWRLQKLLLLIGQLRGSGQIQLNDITSKMLGDLKDSDEYLAKIWNGQMSRDLLQRLQEKYPRTWKDLLRLRNQAEEHFLILLWSNQTKEAIQFARTLYDQLSEKNLRSTDWMLLLGDGYFYDFDYSSAREWYDKGLKAQPGSPAFLTRLSDVWFKLGDLTYEREYREKIYGSLH